VTPTRADRVNRFILITPLDFTLAGGTQREIISARTNNRRMTDRFGSRQVYPNDGQSDDHVFEEGRYLATASRKRGDSDWATNGYT
jgi:hypothetical protein